MLEQIGSVASILGFLKEPVVWIRRRLVRKAVRIETVIERGPVTRRSGFTEPAIKVTVMNESKRLIKIRDIRLMFCGDYGASVLLKAPPERSHPELPMDLDSGTDAHWYIPAEQLYTLLSSLYQPPSTTGPTSREFTLRARCITGTGKVYRSSPFLFLRPEWI